MRTKIDAQLRYEAATLALRFGCESCAHFDPERGRCGNGYPNEAHRGIDLGAVESLEFCKEFELA